MKILTCEGNTSERVIFHSMRYTPERGLISPGGRRLIRIITQGNSEFNKLTR